MKKIKRSTYRGGRRKSAGGLMVFIVLLLIIALAFGGACLWQSYDDRQEEREGSSSETRSSTLPEEPDGEGLSEEDALPDAEESSDVLFYPPKGSSEQEESSGWVKTDFAQAVPESSRVNSDYFDDALFVGDSITDGIQAYAIMNNTTVIAHTGINPETILTKEVIRASDGGLITMADAVAQYPEARKIYIMLGANGIAWIGKDSFVKNYGDFVDVLKEQHPEAIIYVQSILPVTKSKQDGDSRYANSKIDEYNLALQEMAKDKQVYYLNVAEALKDEEGNLPEEASPVDGMHFGPKYYEKWFEYLKLHTV